MEVAREDVSLLEALREDLGVRAVKDGCSPQGQCGCCTVLIDGAPRVSCVTAIRRVAGRAVVTSEGLPTGVREQLVDSFLRHGASQCGFCTPGILCRLAALPSGSSSVAVESALLAHLCRCTGWRSIVDAAVTPLASGSAARAGAGAALRASLEGGVPQLVGGSVVLGGGGFADDTAPAGSLVAVPRAGVSRDDLASVAGWALGPTLAEARAGAGKVQGRRSGLPMSYPVDVPPGSWDIRLQTTWVEPAYLEPDASWCSPGGEAASPVANGGAFGGKADSLAPAAARMLADELGRPVRVLLSREDVVRFGPKRPPVGGGVRLDGSGLLRLGGAASGGETGVSVEAVAITGPPTSSRIRAAGWAEAAVLVAAAAARSAGTTAATVTAADGAQATASVELDGTGWPSGVAVEVDAGDPLDEIVLRSYVQGAAHMALGWVCSEGIAVDEKGHPVDLTIRSFGILRAKDTPPIDVTILPAGSDRAPVRASDAAFAAVAAATWLAQGLPSRWPTMRGTRR